MYCALSSVISDAFLKCSFCSLFICIFIIFLRYLSGMVSHILDLCSLFTRTIDLRMWRKYLLAFGLEIILS